MPKKNRPDKQYQQNAPIAVNRGQVFAAFIDEASGLAAELSAARAFLQERGLVDDFLAWRSKKP